jgi:chromosome segregation ATPase
MLGVQMLLVALLAWRALAPAAGAAAVEGEKLTAAVEKLDKSLSTVESRRQADLARARTESRTEFFDEAFRELKGTDAGAFSRLAERFDQTGKLTEDVTARDAALREARVAIDQVNRRLTELETKSKLDEDRLEAKIASLSTENNRLREERGKYKEELTSLQAKLNPKAASGEGDSADAESPTSVWWWVAGGTLAALAVVAGVWWVGGRGGEPESAAGEETKIENQ